MSHYRACNSVGLRFVSVSATPANGHATVQFDDAAPYAISVSPRTPDMFGDLVAFGCGEDGVGTRMMRPGEQPWRPAGITWRSAYPGKFDPDGWYWLSGRPGDSTRFPLSPRGACWRWRDGVLVGPFETGTTNIEGIAEFIPNGADGWKPVWQNRSKPLIIGAYRLPLWTRTPHWLYGIDANHGDRSIAQDLSTGQWFLVTTETAPNLFPCVKEQPDDRLLVAWNGDKAAFLASPDWSPLASAPAPPVRRPPNPTRLIWRALNGWSNPDDRGYAQPGNAAWGQPQDARPVLEGMPWAADVNGTLLAVLIGTEKDFAPYETKAAQLVACIKEAKRRGCPVAVYADDRFWTRDADEMAAAVERSGVRAVRVVSAHLLPNETPTAAAWRVFSELARVPAPRGLMQRADGVGSAEDEEHFAELCEGLTDRVVLQAVFGVVGRQGHERVIEWHRRAIANMPAGTPPALPSKADDRPNATDPTPIPPKEEPMTRKPLTVAFRRDFSTPRYLGVTDDRSRIDARITDPLDPRAHFELNIFDQPGTGLKPGEFGPGNKVLFRSIQDQVCAYERTETREWVVGASLNLGGLWEIRRGEFPNTWDFVVPAADRAICVEEDGRARVAPYKSVLWSQHGFRLIDVSTGKEIDGTF